MLGLTLRYMGFSASGVWGSESASVSNGSYSLVSVRLNAGGSADSRVVVNMRLGDTFLYCAGLQGLLGVWCLGFRVGG